MGSLIRRDSRLHPNFEAGVPKCYSGHFCPSWWRGVRCRTPVSGRASKRHVWLSAASHRLSSLADAGPGRSTCRSTCLMGLAGRRPFGPAAWFGKSIRCTLAATGVLSVSQWFNAHVLSAAWSVAVQEGGVYGCSTPLFAESTTGRSAWDNCLKLPSRTVLQKLLPLDPQLQTLHAPDLLLLLPTLCRFIPRAILAGYDGGKLDTISQAAVMSVLEIHDTCLFACKHAGMYASMCACTYHVCTVTQRNQLKATPKPNPEPKKPQEPSKKQRSQKNHRHKINQNQWNQNQKQLNPRGNPKPKKPKESTAHKNQHQKQKESKPK